MSKMALTNIVRRAASRVAPLAAPVRGGQRCFHHHHCSAVGGVVSRMVQFFRSSVPSALHHYSTKSGVSLLRIIESEIQFVEQTNEYNEAEAIPRGYPFKLEDNPGQVPVTLTRDYQGEKINVEVHTAKFIVVGSDDETRTAIPLVVRVSGNNGQCFKFVLTAYHDHITINSLLVKESDSSEDKIPYEGPDFGGLNGKFQNAFRKYLARRGIEPSVTNFLHGYMINKESKEYMRWLNNLKKHVEA